MTTPTEPDPADPADSSDPSAPAHKRHHPPTRAEFEARAAQTRADIEAQARAAKAQFDATQEKIRARTGRNLLAAIGIGVLLGALLIVSLFLWKPLFIVFGGLLVGFTTFELASALRFAGRNVPRVASTVVGLGMVLGPLMEENLRRALLISRGDWSVFVTRPLSAVLIAAAAGLLVLAVLPNLRRKRDEVFVEG